MLFHSSCACQDERIGKFIEKFIYVKEFVFAQEFNGKGDVPQFTDI